MKEMRTVDKILKVETIIIIKIGVKKLQSIFNVNNHTFQNQFNGSNE